MHEFLPRITRYSKSQLIPRLKTCLKSTKVIENTPVCRQFPTKLSYIELSSFDRVFPGPLLFGRQLASEEYYIPFEPRRNNNISSAQKSYVWRQTDAGIKMKCWFQFLSTPTADTPGTTLLLHFDSKRYLVGNVAEGTQRAAVQRKLGLVKVCDIFLTGTTNWANTGGLMGMILTLADSVTAAFEGKVEKLKQSEKKQGKEAATIEKPWLNIHGGENLTHTIATARRFIFRKGRPLYTNEFRSRDPLPEDWEPTWKDELIKVWAMVIDPETRSPRKRSHDEFTEDVPLVSTDGEQESKEDLEDRNDQIRKAVVSQMFDSDWRLDALVKMKLSEVKKPAGIFRRNEQGKIEKYIGPTVDEDPSVANIDVLVRNPWPAAMIDDLPPARPCSSSVCYIIKTYPQRGKFNVAAAKAAGIKPGIDFRRLTEGESITTADGNIVTPDMVLAPTKEGGGFAIVDLPNESYIAPLLARGEWSSEKVMAGLEAVIWILAPGLVEDPRLQKFMTEHNHLKHVVSSTDCCSNYLALESAASAAIRLHMFDSERFPTPKFSNEIKPKKDDSPRPYLKARAGLTFQLQPKTELKEDTIIPYLDTATVVRDFKTESKDVVDLADAAREQIASPEYQAQLSENQADIPSKDAEVITLGTGSALPSKYRNVSATLLRVPGYGSYLLDAGENTLGQLKRVLGDELPAVLRDLKAIWISHLHADHHLGTTSVIRAWAEATKCDEATKDNKLLMASHRDMHRWLAEYAQVEDFGHNRTVPVHMRYSDADYYNLSAEDTEKYGLTSIAACGVEHCFGALAVAFTFPNGFKVAYSGDCRPSHKFVKIGRDATLLIHEATFDDELQGDAMAKKHSTTSEALDVGRRMGARRILLTHFSQRYQKIPIMDSHGGKDQVAIVAFDYMRCKIEDFVKLEAFKPALMKLYEDKED
ncbi:tRNA processing endoribonuclease-like protein Trz1 [Mollisia scopiformis]|uniref:ribonuclease Z n=1 Tax=Mollisia scopiformis TaxID=149040 RepID=A0A194WXP5_MOLSC|nr:tRNA processing endoribonuclease-like protein Trz1 [Mollisia scopiformis]KUJ12700.1 tRNA processing endoribonuclease-like protein Trz1 [Mollisia scopiformis]